MTKAKKQLKVTLVRSTAHKLQAHKDTIRGLGLRRQRHSVVLEDTPAVRGMCNAVGYMIRVEEI
jgi:large subunit ribosomal protein L30